MKVGKTTGIFDKQRNPYKRWGVKTGVGIGEIVQNPKKQSTYMKIITDNNVFYYAGFDNDKKMILASNLDSAIKVGKKNFNKIKRLIDVSYKEVFLFSLTK